MEEIKILDKTFVPYISSDEIEQAIKRLANTIEQDYKDKTPILVGVLNGVVMFMSDFLKYYDGHCEISFLQMKSYVGTSSSGMVKRISDIPIDVTDRHVILMEDIVDTGNTLAALYDIMQKKPVKSVKVATLLYKPDAYKKDLNIDYVGLSIPDKFVVGYGLDYDGLGRNLAGIYQIKENK